MKNQQGDSLTHRVRQNDPTFLASATIDLSFTPERATSMTTHFLERSRAALRGETGVTSSTRTTSGKQFQRPARPVSVTRTSSVLTSDAEQAAPALLPEIVEDMRRRLAQQIRENRETRRAESRARFHQLLNAATDQAAPDFKVPSSLLEARQGISVAGKVTLSRPPVSGPAWEELSAEAVLAAAPWVSKGARRLFCLVHRVGVAAAKARRYRLVPSTCTFHLPQLLAAAVLRYATRHVRRLMTELEAAGLIDAGGHAANVTTVEGKKRRMWDGCLWAVKLKPSNSNAYLRPDDWQHEWRDFDEDLKRGRTAKKLMSYLKTYKDEERQFHLIKEWAVNPNMKITSLSLERTFQAEQREDVQDVVYSLPLLSELTGPALAQAIGRAASEIAHALNDSHSRRHWCGLLWAATRSDSLEGFSAQLLRLLADVGESAELRNPGALFAARLRSA